MAVAAPASLLGDLLALPRPAHWTELRARAEAALEGRDLPTTREEAWKYTDLKPLRDLAFRPSEASAPATPAMLPEAPGTRIAFLNGAFAPHLSNLSALPPGVRLLRLTQATEAAQGFGTLVVPGGDPFADLNTARFTEGALLVIPAGLRVETVLHVVFHNAGTADAPALSLPRLQVVLEKGAQATLVEEHLGTGTYLSCPVAEVLLHDGARLRHERIQRESNEAFHLASLGARLEGHAVYALRTVHLGSRLGRLTPGFTLAQPEAELELDGLALLGGTQLMDTHSRITHAVPACRTRQLYKSIVDGESRSVFNGRIHVMPGAQQTDARQQARSLILSETARVDAKPELEIYADDVKCAHGAAIGQLDPEELFYLQSRGLNPTLARNLLTYAFAADVLATVPVPSLRRQLRKAVLERTHAAGLEL